MAQVRFGAPLDSYPTKDEQNEGYVKQGGDRVAAPPGCCHVAWDTGCQEHCHHTRAPVLSRKAESGARGHADFYRQRSSSSSTLPPGGKATARRRSATQGGRASWPRSWQQPSTRTFTAYPSDGFYDPMDKIDARREYAGVTYSSLMNTTVIGGGRSSSARPS